MHQGRRRPPHQTAPPRSRLVVPAAPRNAFAHGWVSLCPKEKLATPESYAQVQTRHRNDLLRAKFTGICTVSAA
eukprot:187779-Chlamydomonas_euryale.AAC.5